MKDLTEQQIKRQDYVDDTIYFMIKQVLEYRDKRTLWDIDVISEIREVVEKHYIDSEEESFEFYPWID